MFPVLKAAFYREDLSLKEPPSRRQREKVEFSRIGPNLNRFCLLSFRCETGKRLPPRLLFGRLSRQRNQALIFHNVRFSKRGCSHGALALVLSTMDVIKGSPRWPLKSAFSSLVPTDVAASEISGVQKPELRKGQAEQK